MSWSLLEAMAAGCVVVASDTAPVREVIIDGHNGMLVDFFDHHGIAKRIAKVLDSVDEYDCLRSAAKLTASRFDVAYGTKHYFDVFESAMFGHLKKQPARQFDREI